MTTEIDFPNCQLKILDTSGNYTTYSKNSIVNSNTLTIDCSNVVITGQATAITQTAGNNSTRLATTAFVQSAVSGGGGGGSWVGTAASNLNMAGYTISNCPSIDCSASSTLAIGPTNATAITIGSLSTPIPTTIYTQYPSQQLLVNSIDATTATTLRIGTSASAGVTVGRSTFTTLLQGNPQALSLNVTSSGSPFTFCATMTTGSLTMCSALTSGSVLIGNATSTGTVSLKAGSGNVRMETIDRITSGVLSIGSNSLTTGVNLNNKALTNITLGANNFITMSTSNTTLPTGNQVGYSTAYISNASATTSATPNTITDLQNSTNVPVGTYIFRYTFLIETLAVTKLTISLSQASATLNPSIINGFTTGIDTQYGTISGTLQFVNNTNNGVFLVAQSSTASVVISNIYGNLTRIA